MPSFKEERGENPPLLPFFGEGNKLIPKQMEKPARITAFSPIPAQLPVHFSIHQFFQHHFSFGSALRNTAYFCLQDIGIKVGSVLLQSEATSLLPSYNLTEWIFKALGPFFHWKVAVYVPEAVT